MTKQNSDAYLQPLKREDLPELEPLIAESQEFLGFVPNDLLTLARLPLPAQKIMEFSITVFDEATLPDELLYLVALLASTAAGCRYCTAHTASKCNGMGIEELKIAAIWEFETSPLFDERERAALSFAFKAAQTPSGLDKVDYDTVAEYFTETEVCEILMVVCQMGFWNRWNDAVATKLETTPLAFAEAKLPETHWQTGKHADV